MRSGCCKQGSCQNPLLCKLTIYNAERVDGWASDPEATYQILPCWMNMQTEMESCQTYEEDKSMNKVQMPSTWSLVSCRQLDRVTEGVKNDLLAKIVVFEISIPRSHFEVGLLCYQVLHPLSKLLC